MVKKIAIIYPNLMIKGGAEFVCLNFIKALQDNYEVTLITAKKPDFKELHEKFKIDIDTRKINIIIPFWAIILEKMGLFLVYLLYIEKYGRKKRDKYDLLISSREEADFGERGIQYIHFPVAAYKIFKESQLFKVKNKLLLKFYSLLFKSLLPEKKGIEKNLTICNSIWTKNLFEKYYKSDVKVINPPVRDDFLKVSWEKRKDGFVCIGNIVKRKRQDFIIKIIDHLREEGIDVHLHIFGRCFERSFSKKIIKMCKDRDYVHYEGFANREHLIRIVSSHKFGIHAMKNEHYGIAPAEMINAGCIPFVHNSGGQKYIVKRNKNLVFDDFKDAVEIIKKMIKNKKLQKITLDALKKSKINSTYLFQSKIRYEIEKFLNS